ncbi:hypothetical protein AYK26_01655 [Euryarchaeota archaeon SM23-78]|nr:MAG: hypothetical protein AYK26_01655 [Euryarchaeota archaeon SM23-78]MBW3000484.1 cupin domain-containing protein [Candidatus Woesearchaeota archaeon]
MIVKKASRKEKVIANNCVVWEHDLNNKNLGFALAKINGRFPNSERVANKICQEVYYVISGKGSVFLEGKEIKLEQGDVFLIKAGKKYYVTGKDLVLAVSSSPAWYAEQQEFCD